MAKNNSKNLFGLILAGTLLNTPAVANDSTNGMGVKRDGLPLFDLHLPPIPHIETMPWLTHGTPTKGSKVDMLWRPKLDTPGPFLLEPQVPPAQFAGSLFRTQ